MPIEPGVRSSLVNTLNDWQLNPHDLRLQMTVCRAILPKVREAFPVDDFALQFRANGERKILVTVGDKTQAFDTALQVADWIGEQQKMVEQRKKAS